MNGMVKEGGSPSEDGLSSYWSRAKAAMRAYRPHASSGSPMQNVAGLEDSRPHSKANS